MLLIQARTDQVEREEGRMGVPEFIPLPPILTRGVVEKGNKKNAVVV